MQRVVNELLPRTPLIASTVWQHYTHGPPAKSWTLKLHLAISLIKDVISRTSTVTIEDAQAGSYRPVSLPNFVLSTPFVIPDSYRAEARGYLVKLLEGMEDEIGWNWKEDWKKRGVGEITGEWLDVEKNREAMDNLDEAARAKKLTEHTDGRVIFYLHGGYRLTWKFYCYYVFERWIAHVLFRAYYLCSTNSHRFVTWRVAEKSSARTFAINYRLAPQNPFPAAVEDALSAYLYLLKPPPNSRHPPTDPKKIVIMGDSAGGGLTMATLLAIRDAGLPMPGGAVGLSPWMDLTHAMPSIYSNLETDYLPATGFVHKDSAAGRFEDVPLLEGRRVVVGVDGKKMKRIHFYAPNEALKIKYVTPLYDDKNLDDLPPLLLQTGSGERLRDEAILTAYKASGAMPNCLTKISRNPARLELYIDMPHFFQMFTFSQQAAIAIERIGAFVCDVTNPAADKFVSKEPLEIFMIDAKGQVETVAKKTREEMWSDKVLTEWEERLSIGVEERAREIDKLGFK